MTNREWLENIGVPDEMIRCDEYDDGEKGRCGISLRILYSEQPWQTKKSITIAIVSAAGSEVQTLSRWYVEKYIPEKVLADEDTIRDFLKD